MKTIIQKIDPENFQDEELDEACAILKNGGLVAFPTETVYGLGGDGLNPAASARIYAAKGRPSDNPLILHIASMDDLKEIAGEIPDGAYKLAESFWPGPMTMIFKKRESVPYETTGGLDTVAVRMPSHPVARELIRRSGVYIAAPSANLSGRPSPTKHEHVIEDLDGRIDMILASGPVGIGLESTIIDMSVPEPMLLRPGYITREMIESITGKIKVDPVVVSRTPLKDLKPKAPGMKYRHYAPRGDMEIIEGDEDQVVKKINSLTEECERKGIRAAVITTDENRDRYTCKNVYSVGARKTEGSIAAGVFDVLREMDHIGAQKIYAESFESDRLGMAIMNRMIKAAAYQIVDV
ncbi:MAG: L-threonylcarbamoyladenylate synthase [Lachnospiraceae bacterium]|nr:L-threonylcarbamoyladenylate synthase [Lachnospiraceae bacterium]MEE3460604.1 L-threonylcarbamoyladenylate synthase [Lachnospiraceae bacterium]